MSTRHQSKRVRRIVMCALGLAVLCTTIASTASAQTPGRQKRTTVTFSGPVEIPGVGAQVLPAGTYVFKVLNTLSDRNIVQIFNADQSRVYATILAIPNYRLKATDKTVMTFAERAAGDPQAIRAWFYPGDNWGQEFVYPKSKAVALAKATGTPVLYIADDLAPNLVAPIRTAAEPSAVALQNAPLMVVRPTGEDAAVSEVIAPPARTAGRLPTTATVMPLLALMGILCLGVGFSVRRSCAL